MLQRRSEKRVVAYQAQFDSVWGMTCLHVVFTDPVRGGAKAAWGVCLVLLFCLAYESMIRIS